MPIVSSRFHLLGLMFLMAVSGCGPKSSSQPVASPEVEETRPTTAPVKSAASGGEPALPGEQKTAQDMPIKSQPDRPANAAKQPPLEQVYRPDDQLPEISERVIEAASLKKYESKRLVLITDVDSPDLAKIPGYVDELYVALEKYFGPLPPARNGKDFRVYGFVIADQSRFRDAGLIPEVLPPFEHGRHLQNQFWMNDQKYDYYRRHLLFHEFTHCFTDRIAQHVVSPWYFEGVAEQFGTHREKPAGGIEFGVMPESWKDATGFGRINTISQEIAANRFKTIADLFKFEWKSFTRAEEYSWSWAGCYFLANNPRYRDRFQKLGQLDEVSSFRDRFEVQFGKDHRDVETEWALFIHGLQFGYDVQLAAIEFQEGSPLATLDLKVSAARGWQSARIILEPGKSYRISAEGQVVLGRTSRPWLSEPQGISVQYASDEPLGKLLGTLRPVDAGEIGQPEPMLRSFVVGRGTTIKPDSRATLYLRVNDHWNSLKDNEGEYAVSIREE